MSFLTTVQCDFCQAFAWNGAPLAGTAEDAREELKDMGWLRIDEKDQCKRCAKPVAGTQDMFMQQVLYPSEPSTDR